MSNNLNKLSSYRVGIVLFCFIVTLIFLHGVSGTRPTKISKPLSGFPAQLGPWTLDATRTSAADVIDMLGVDDYIDYSYTDKIGNRVSLYVGFYDSVGVGKGGYHSPKNCLPGGGWGIDSTKAVQIAPQSRRDSPVTVAQMVIREGSEYQVVLYWFQNRGRIIDSEYWEKIYLVLDALLKKRRDGSFVRLMAYAVEGDIEKTEMLLKNFAELALTELDEYLPGE